jgi:hypothetical protein
MTRAATAAEHADHDRDLRKADTRPSYDQRAAVAGLIGYSEAILESGLLGEIMESQFRHVIARALVAFNMPSKTERADA